MEKHNLNAEEMQNITGVRADLIRSYKSRKINFSDKTWILLEKGMENYVPSIKGNSIVPSYIVRCLDSFDNTVIAKSKIRKKEVRFLNELKKLGYKCRIYCTGDKHYVIENVERFTTDPNLIEGRKMFK